MYPPHIRIGEAFLLVAIDALGILHYEQLVKSAE
jgi:hypothetical protein